MSPHIQKEIAQLGLILGARGPLPQLLTEKQQLLDELEKLEEARKRSSQSAYNASQYEERMTKQFFFNLRAVLAIPTLVHFTLPLIGILPNLDPESLMSTLKL
jgi:hypothetical protein